MAAAPLAVKKVALLRRLAAHSLQPRWLALRSPSPWQAGKEEARPEEREQERVSMARLTALAGAIHMVLMAGKCFVMDVVVQII